jgi:hypothetical protein
MGNSGCILWEKTSELRNADWEVGSFENLWLPVKECNIIADSVRIMCTGSRPGAKMFSFVTELRSPETSTCATFVLTPWQDSFYFGWGRKNCVAYKHNSPDIKNVQPHKPPLPFVWCHIRLHTCLKSLKGVGAMLSWRCVKILLWSIIPGSKLNEMNAVNFWISSKVHQVWEA